MTKPKQMECYHELVREILSQPKIEMDRTGVGTRSVFGRTLRFDLSEGFPILTTKRTHWKSIVAELLWFLDGSTNNNDLIARGATIWNEWQDAHGELPHIYGKQWRRWETPSGPKDQLAELIASLSTADGRRSRRLVVSAWNVTDLPRMALPPCHYCFQCNVDSDDRLSMIVNLRSQDLFLGTPFNIASYAALLHLLVAVVNQTSKEPDLLPGELIMNMGNAHVYANHEEQARIMLSRQHLEPAYLRISRTLLTPDLKGMPNEVLVLENYNYHPAIKAPVAV